MRKSGSRFRVGAQVAAGLLAGGALLVGAPAFAASGSIDHIQTSHGRLKVLYSLPVTASNATPDLSTLSVKLDRTRLNATGQLAATAGGTVRRTAILAIDVSKSMAANNKFASAKSAAVAFLNAAPKDLYVGVVTFAGKVTLAQQPSLNRTASKTVINGLSLSSGTRLYDGISAAVRDSGSTGQRSVLVLSDGRDTSGAPISAVTHQVRSTKTIVDVVALAQRAADKALLGQIANAGNGQVIAANDPAGLSKVFKAEAAVLAHQLLVTVRVPASLKATEGTLSVSVTAGGQTYADSAFVSLAQAQAQTPTSTPNVTRLVPAAVSGLHISQTVMLAGLGAAVIAFLVLLLSMLGVFSNTAATVEQRVDAYTQRGARRRANAPPTAQGVTAHAVGIAAKALESNKSFEATLGTRLEAAGMSLKPSEWLLLHAAIAFSFAIIGLLITSGNIWFGIVALMLGAVGPWFYLGFKRSRRLKRFRSQLAETLQLMSGSLTAGLSLAQSADTVVREGSDPIASEFRRALVEARLGVELEEALNSVSDRMQSKDFRWVVMAIRIQREVGGNLAELLNTVAATIREREYLERQVSALSAEGRLSVWVLGSLPPGFISYLLLANPTYLHPMITNTLGFIMLGVMAVLLFVGIFWMKKLVKVDV